VVRWRFREATEVHAALNGIFFAGGAFGAIGQGILADKFGRRRALQVSCAIMIMATALLSGSVHIAMFLVGRLFQGFWLVACSARN
jgi:MFS family permease